MHLNMSSMKWRSFSLGLNVLIILVQTPCHVCFQAGAEVDLSPFESKITPLMRAIGSGSPNSLIQSLLQSGADPHLVDASGRTVLHWAAREQNVWAIKWLIAENVDLEAPAPVGVNSGAKSTFHFLFDDCNRAFKRNDSWLSLCLKHLQVIQALAIAGAHLVANSPNNKRAQAQLTEDLNWFIPRSEILSNFPRNRTDKLEAILREIREIVHILTDILGNPLPLKYICRIQIRRSLGRDFRKKLNHLHVPGALQEYLMVYKESDSLLWFSLWNSCKMHCNANLAYCLLLKYDRFCIR